MLSPQGLSSQNKPGGISVQPIGDRGVKEEIRLPCQRPLCDQIGEHLLIERHVFLSGSLGETACRFIEGKNIFILINHMNVSVVDFLQGEKGLILMIPSPHPLKGLIRKENLNAIALRQQLSSPCPLLVEDDILLAKHLIEKGSCSCAEVFAEELV